MNDIIHIDINNLAPHPRQNEIYANSKIDDEFLESIQVRGILQPILVCKAELFADEKYKEHVGEKEYVIISGHRRYAAAQILEFETVPCIVKEYEDADKTFWDLLFSNLQRKKTDKEALKEIKALKKIISALTYKKQLSKLNDVSEERQSELYDRKRRKSPVNTAVKTVEEIYFGEDLKTLLQEVGQNGASVAKILSKKLNVPEKRINLLIAVMDDEFQEKAMAVLYDKGMTTKDGDILFDDWANVRERFENGEITLNAAYEEIQDLKKAIKNKLVADNTDGKNSNPKPATSPNWLIPVAEDADSSPLFYTAGHIEVGIIPVQGVNVYVRTSAGKFIVDFDKLIKDGGAK
ncbi:MAG: ParB N-terminal domain-containing protein [Bacteroidales bacterium]|nr:ParB N-terminal domain-containing protein [Bacteroidales bacterium]